jgi:hypothetical protein
LTETCGQAATIAGTSSPRELTNVLRKLATDRTVLDAAQSNAAHRGAQLTWGRAADSLLEVILNQA